MGEHMTQPEHIASKGLDLIELTAKAGDIERLSVLIGDVSRGGAGSKEFQALEALDYRYRIADVMGRAQADFSPVKAAKPHVPQIDEVPHLDDARVDLLADQHNRFDSQSRGYLDNLSRGMADARQPQKTSEQRQPLELVRQALQDKARQQSALLLLQGIKKADKADLEEVSLMMKGDASEELWEAVLAGREAVSALLHGDRGDTAQRLVGMWQRDLESGLAVTERNLAKAIKWLEQGA